MFKKFYVLKIFLLAIIFCSLYVNSAVVASDDDFKAKLSVDTKPEPNSISITFNGPEEGESSFRCELVCQDKTLNDKATIDSADPEQATNDSLAKFKVGQLVAGTNFNMVFADLQRGTPFHARCTINIDSTVYEAVFESTDENLTSNLTTDNNTDIKMFNISFSESTAMNNNGEAIKNSLQEIFAGYNVYVETIDEKSTESITPLENQSCESTSNSLPAAAAQGRLLQEVKVISVSLVPKLDNGLTDTEVNDLITGLTASKINENITDEALKLDENQAINITNVDMPTVENSSIILGNNGIKYDLEKLTINIKSSTENDTFTCLWALKKYSNQEEKNSNYFDDKTECTAEDTTNNTCGKDFVINSLNNNSLTVSNVELDLGTYTLDLLCDFTSKDFFFLPNYKFSFDALDIIVPKKQVLASKIDYVVDNNVPNQIKFTLTERIADTTLKCEFLCENSNGSSVSDLKVIDLKTYNRNTNLASYYEESFTESTQESASISFNEMARGFNYKLHCIWFKTDGKTQTREFTSNKVRIDDKDVNYSTTANLPSNKYYTIKFDPAVSQENLTNVVYPSLNKIFNDNGLQVYIEGRDAKPESNFNDAPTCNANTGVIVAMPIIKTRFLQDSANVTNLDIFVYPLNNSSTTLTDETVNTLVQSIDLAKINTNKPDDATDLSGTTVTTSESKQAEYQAADITISNLVYNKESEELKMNIKTNVDTTLECKWGIKAYTNDEEKKLNYFADDKTCPAGGIENTCGDLGTVNETLSEKVIKVGKLEDGDYTVSLKCNNSNFYSFNAVVDLISDGINVLTLMSSEEFKDKFTWDSAYNDKNALKVTANSLKKDFTLICEVHCEGSEGNTAENLVSSNYDTPPVKSNLVSFFKKELDTDDQPVDMIFDNMQRGTNYTLHCVYYPSNNSSNRVETSISSFGSGENIKKLSTSSKPDAVYFNLNFDKDLPENSNSNIIKPSLSKYFGDELVVLSQGIDNNDEINKNNLENCNNQKVQIKNTVKRVLQNEEATVTTNTSETPETQTNTNNNKLFSYVVYAPANSATDKTTEQLKTLVKDISIAKINENKTGENQLSTDLTLNVVEFAKTNLILQDVVITNYKYENENLNFDIKAALDEEIKCKWAFRSYNDSNKQNSWFLSNNCPENGKDKVCGDLPVFNNNSKNITINVGKLDSGNYALDLKCIPNHYFLYRNNDLDIVVDGPTITSKILPTSEVFNNSFSLKSSPRPNEIILNYANSKANTTLKCELICANANFNTDEKLIETSLEKNPLNTVLAAFFEQSYTEDAASSEVTFQSLQRQTTYKLHCVLYETNNKGMNVSTTINKLGVENPANLKTEDQNPSLLFSLNFNNVLSEAAVTNTIAGVKKLLSDYNVVAKSTSSADELKEYNLDQCSKEVAIITDKKISIERRNLQENNQTNTTVDFAIVYPKNSDKNVSQADLKKETDAITVAKINENLEEGSKLTTADLSLDVKYTETRLFSNDEFKITNVKYENDAAKFNIQGPKTDNKLLCNWALRKVGSTVDNNNWFVYNSCTKELQDQKVCGIIDITNTAQDKSLDVGKLDAGSYNIDIVCKEDVLFTYNKSLISFKLTDLSIKLPTEAELLASITREKTDKDTSKAYTFSKLPVGAMMKIQFICKFADFVSDEDIMKTNLDSVNVTNPRQVKYVQTKINNEALKITFDDLQRGMTYKMRVLIYQEFIQTNKISLTVNSFTNEDKTEEMIKAGEELPVQRVQLDAPGIKDSKESIRNAFRRIFPGYLILFDSDDSKQIENARPKQCNTNRATVDFANETTIETSEETSQETTASQEEATTTATSTTEATTTATSTTEATTTLRFLQDAQTLIIALIPDVNSATSMSTDQVLQNINNLTVEKLNENLPQSEQLPATLQLKKVILEDKLYQKTDFEIKNNKVDLPKYMFDIKGPSNNLECSWAISDLDNTKNSNSADNWFDYNSCTDEIKNKKMCGSLEVTTTSAQRTIEFGELSNGNYRIDGVCNNKIFFSSNKSMFDIGTIKKEGDVATVTETETTKSSFKYISLYGYTAIIGLLIIILS